MHIPTGVCDLNEQNVIATITSSRGGIIEREGERVIIKKGNTFAFRFIFLREGLSEVDV